MVPRPPDARPRNNCPMKRPNKFCPPVLCTSGIRRASGSPKMQAARTPLVVLMLLPYYLAKSPPVQLDTNLSNVTLL